MLSKLHRSNKGFTLIELMIVVVIIGIVLGVVAVNATPNPRSQIIDDTQKMARLIDRHRIGVANGPNSLRSGFHGQ